MVIYSVVCVCVFVATSVRHRIIKSLIPASVVPEMAVLKLVSVVCANIPPVVTQVDIARCYTGDRH